MSLRENPIQGLYDEYLKIIHGSTIKYNYLADANDSLAMRKEVDAYMDAYYKRDTFDLYEYSTGDYNLAGVTDLPLIAQYMNGEIPIPQSLREKLLDDRRAQIMKNYVESNNYYRMLNGLPDLDDTELIYIDYDTCMKYGIQPYLPIHEIQDAMGTHYITLLESIGYIDQLIKENPDKEYLKHLGSRRISIIDARNARNFQLLYLDSSVNESIRNQFSLIYEQCREYFMTSIYIFDYRKIIEYYDRFMAMCIMLMALQQVTARTISSAIDRDFFDSHGVQALYEEFDIPFYPRLDSKVQRAICQNINMLIQNKGTNKVIYDIASLLGFNRIDIFKYYLMKEHKMDVDGNPIFASREEFDEDSGYTREVFDYERMFDVYFQKVKLNDYDYHEALEDPSNRVSYETVTSGDPFWVEDKDLYNEIWQSEYNYKESKYLGVTISYKLSEMLYDNIALIRMIFDHKDALSPITLKLPSILGDTPVSLFDTFVLLCGLTSKKYGLGGEIVSKPSQVIHVIDKEDKENVSWDGVNETFAFDFSWFKSDEYDEKTAEIFSYMSDAEIEEFESYVSVLTIPGGGNDQKIQAINDMYKNVKVLSRFLTERMIRSKTIEEYEAFKKFFRALYYSQETARMFSIKKESGEDVPAQTYQEYLNYENPALGSFLESLDRDNCHAYIDHVITRLEEIIEDVGYLYLLNNSTSDLQDVLLDLIRFFKSYTTDMIGLNTVYIFDFKPDNLIKLMDRMENIYKKLGLRDDLFFGYADAVTKTKVHLTADDDLKFREYLRVISTYYMIDTLALKDTITMRKLMDLRDTLHLTDDVFINAIYHYHDDLSLKDLILYTHSEAELIEHLILKDMMKIRKKSKIDELYFVNDALGKIRKESVHDDNLPFRDACFVVNPR